MDISILRKETVNKLLEIGVSYEETVAEVDLLIENILAIKKKDIIINQEHFISEDKLKHFNETIALRIKNRVPIQYLLKFTYFYGLKFYVNKNVLIPRNDTELLVETVIDFIKRNNATRVADIGVGSGNISIAILKNCPQVNVIATDISYAAIETAKHNVTYHNLTDRIEFINTSFLEGINKKFDVIASNPPYIPLDIKETLAPEVLLHEPEMALFTSSDDPLENYIKISEQAKKCLHFDGMLAVETECNYAYDVKALFESHQWKNAMIYNDLCGLPRVVTAYK